VKRRRHSDAIDRAMEQSLRLGEFIDYNESWSFITELEEVAELIDQLLPEEAERAVALYETFIAGCYEKAAEIDDDAEARMLIERALDHANTTVQIRPTFAAGHRMRADALNLLDRPVESAQAQLRTAELERDDPVLYLAAGLRLIQTSQWDDAISALHRLDELEPDNPRTLYLLGSALINRGDVEDGRGVLERALSLAPGEERIIAVLKQLDDPDAESTPE